MVTCSAVVDGGRWEEASGSEDLQLARKTASRTLVYDVDTGSLRYSKLRVDTVQSRSPISPKSAPCSFKAELGDDVDSPRPPLSCPSKLHCESFTESGESSPTCVLQNSTRRSNSSSPTMSIVSKASSDPGPRSQDRGAKVGHLAATATSPRDLDEDVITISPRSELQKIGDVREHVKKLENINTSSGRPKGAASGRRMGSENSSVVKENGCWDALKGEALVRDSTLQTSTNPPFKSIQCAVADSKNIMEATATTPAGVKKSKLHGGIPAAGGVSRLASSQSASIMQKSPGIFSFNATYMSRADSDLDSDLEPIHGDTATTGGATPKLQQLDSLSRRAYLAPLLKPTPSKWDDAEKWLPGSECQSAKAKSRSGPLLAQMVVAQAGMSIPWKGPPQTASAQTERQCTSDGLHPDSGSETGDVKNVPAPPTDPLAAGLVDFIPGEKEQLNLLLDQYSVEGKGSRGGPGPELLAAVCDGSTSPSRLNGSFMSLSARMEKPLAVDFSPTTPPEDYDSRCLHTSLDLDLKTGSIARTAVSTRDMGTAMTPVASVEPSRTSTPLRATTTTVKSPTRGVQVSALSEHSRKDAETMTSSRNEGGTMRAESPRTLMMTEKELQEKTRQEIVVLGTQLGKANIAAAWAAREKEKQESSAIVRTPARDLDNIRRDVFASRAAAWQEAEMAKYTSMFEQEQAKIQAWEEHEKAKAEAEMCRVEIKVERLKSQAYEKLAHRLATARRQAEKLRVVAKTKRAKAAAKAVRKAEILKTTGKITNLLFLSCFCI